MAIEKLITNIIKNLLLFLEVILFIHLIFNIFYLSFTVSAFIEENI